MIATVHSIILESLLYTMITENFPHHAIIMHTAINRFLFRIHTQFPQDRLTETRETMALSIPHPPKGNLNQFLAKFRLLVSLMSISTTTMMRERWIEDEDETEKDTEIGNTTGERKLPERRKKYGGWRRR